MANADGSVIINTELDDKQAQAELNRLTNKIKRLDDKVALIGRKKMPLEQQAETLSEALERAKLKLDSLKNNGGAAEAIAEQAETVKSLQYRWNQTTNQLNRYEKTISDSKIEIEFTKEKAGELASQLSAAGQSAEKMNEGTKKAAKSADAFSKRIKSVVRSALVFTVITQALSRLRNWAGDVIKASPQASAAIAKLKGALLTLVQPLVNIIIPAFTTLVNILTVAVTKIAAVFAALAGSTLQNSQDAAKALNKQTKALNGTGAAAKKAGKSLAGFDEINKLSAADAGGGGASASDTISPDFSFLDGVSERLEGIARDVLLIAAGFSLWKLSENLPGMLGDIGAKIAGITIAVGGLMLMWDGFKDAWENGIDWGNFLETIGGAAALVAGLALSFGAVGAGIGLVVASAAMFVLAIHDMIENGVNLKNTLMLIASILGAGLGISLLTGSWIPLLVAAIASIIVAMLAWTGNLGEFIDSIKGIFSGLVEFITGVFSGDMDKAFNGLKKMLKNLINADIAIIESFVNTVIRAINWLISQLNKIHFEIPDWVPGIGGNSWGINIPPIAEAKIPRLAQGAVIPPNREFLAVLGDQKSGTNIETPLPTMIQAFKQALAESGLNGSSEAVLMLDRDVLGKVVYKLNKSESSRIGVNLAGV